MVPLERSIQDSIIKMMKKRPGCYWLKVHGAAMTRAGTPDILGCQRVERQGKVLGLFFAMEVKRPGGKPTPIQVVQMRRWEEAGAHVAVVYSKEDAEKFLDALILIDLAEGV